MIEVTNTSQLTLQPGQAITFDSIVMKTNCCCFRTNAPMVKLNRNGIHKITFSGNIGVSGGTGTAQLNIQLSGITLPETTMLSVTNTSGLLSNVSRSTTAAICCGNYDTVSVVNTGTTAVTIGVGSTLIAERMCM